MSKQITTITILNFKGLSSKIFAFKMMRDIHPLIQKIPGITFYKKMGSGKGKGFNPFPDWGTYALLINWENMAFAKRSLQSDILSHYQNHTHKTTSYFLENIKTHGMWDGHNPFDASHITPKVTDNIAVITRATIKPSKLLKFWSYVPNSHKPLKEQENGLIYTKGIGEIPIIQMATFSIWESIEALKKFAYGSKEHLKAIEKTRKLNWYKEELFARFIVLEKIVS